MALTMMGARVGRPARGSGFFGSGRVALAPARPSVVAAPVQRGVYAMAGKKKDVRITITMECTEQKAAGVAGISRYTTMKSRRNTPGRLELMKYNKYMRKHTLHREVKK